ncbi:unnamed protein product, partial [Closterium sp. NIES-54]
MYGSSSRPYTVRELLDRLRRAAGDRCGVAVDQGARQLQLTGLGDGPASFSSDFLRDFCRGEGILQSFTLPASPQQNGIAERRIGLVMEVA